MKHLGKDGYTHLKVNTAFSSSIQKLVPTPATLRMSGGMPGKHNLHMVQSMPKCSHAWSSIYGGGCFQTRTTSSHFSTLWCRLMTTTPGMYQGNYKKLYISTHIYQPLLGPPIPPERIVHQSYDINNPNNSLKFPPKSDNIIFSLLVHCQSAHNSNIAY